MRNCLKTQLKAAVNDDNLPIFEFVRVKVNTTSFGKKIIPSGAKGTNLIGSYVEGFTFTDGTSKIETSSFKNIPENSVGYLYVPKYTDPIRFNNVLSTNDTYCGIAFNIDDFSYITGVIMPSTITNVIINIKPMPDGSVSSGSLERYLDWHQPVVSQINVLNSNVKADIESQSYSRFPTLTRLDLLGSYAKGEIKTFISNYCQANSAACKERTNDLYIRCTGNNSTVTFNGTKATVYYIAKFTGSSTVNIRNDVGVYLLTYDIDTDTFSPYQE